MFVAVPPHIPVVPLSFLRDPNVQLPHNWKFFQQLVSQKNDRPHSGGGQAGESFSQMKPGIRHTVWLRCYLKKRAPNTSCLLQESFKWSAIGETSRGRISKFIYQCVYPAVALNGSLHAFEQPGKGCRATGSPAQNTAHIERTMKATGMRVQNQVSTHRFLQKRGVKFTFRP